MLEKQKKRRKRHQRVRAKILNAGKTYRLCVFRSNKYIYAQIIDDQKDRTVVAVSDLGLKKNQNKQKSKSSFTPLALAQEVGKLVAEKAKELKIEKVVFDRGGYKYHGRVKAVAEGAREGGLKF